VGPRGLGPESEGAAARGVCPFSRRSNAVHLFAFGGRGAAGARARPETGDGDRLRNRPAGQRRAAAPDADERGRGAHVRTGRRAVSGSFPWRPRRAARRHTRRASGRRRHRRRRHGRHERGEDGARARRERDRPRQIGRSAARAGRSVSRPRHHADVQRLQHRRRRTEGRSFDRRRAHSGGEGAEARDGRNGENDESRSGHRGRGRRPGRFRRNRRPRHDAQRPGVRQARRRSLRGQQHSGRGSAHFDARFDERHAPLRAGSGQQRVRTGGARERPLEPGSERARGANRA